MTILRTVGPLIVTLVITLPLCGQVSPGPLSKAHVSLDGPLDCASCHVFTGARKLKCLPCHGEIRKLVNQREGYHGREVKKGDAECVRCHTEHYGRDFRIYKWDTSKEEFDHSKAGYPLVGKHAGLTCEKCHNSKFIAPADRKLIKVKDLNKTFEGLHTACLTCHEDTHRKQLGADCEKCHSVDGWKPLIHFDHMTTRYPLTGKHQDVACDKCHKPTAENAKVIQYVGMSFETCTGCHQDPHHGSFKQACESCHGTDNWKRIRQSNGFDHSTTKFPLTGKHADVACFKCHANSNFSVRLPYEKCVDCHKDTHKGQFDHRPDHGECGPCHTVDNWKPSTFIESSHKDTAYPLTGKHQGLACDKCHMGPGFDKEKMRVDIDYHPSYKACLDCHKDIHGGQFAAPPRANKCEDCHTVSGFQPSTFTLKDHQTSRFDLRGSHTAVPCQDCHKKEDKEDKVDAVTAAAMRVPLPSRITGYHFDSLACETCHKDPHQGQFPKVLISRATATPGDTGAVSIASEFSLLTPRATATPGGSGTVSTANEFSVLAPRARASELNALISRAKAAQSVCESCHGLVSWQQLKPFDHGLTDYVLTGGHTSVACLECHKAQNPDEQVRSLPFKVTDKCDGCHEDIHGGQFEREGTVDCASCHTTTRWPLSELEFDHETRTKFSLQGAHQDVPCRLCHNDRREINGRLVIVYKDAPHECEQCHRKE